MARMVAGKRVGALEAAVLEELWRHSEPVGARELLEALPGRPRAYTTVLTILTRLAEKGLVEKIPSARAYRFRATGSPDQLAAGAIADLLASAGEPRAVLAYLVEAIDDPDLLRELARLARRPRRR
ncbi:MAG: BlaI/MecI/CopY family transcriptional regulator [Acidimicrobiales bacterium]